MKNSQLPTNPRRTPQVNANVAYLTSRLASFAREYHRDNRGTEDLRTQIIATYEELKRIVGPGQAHELLALLDL